MTRPNIDALFDAHTAHQASCETCAAHSAGPGSGMCAEGHRLLMAWGRADQQAAHEQSIIDSVEDELDGLHCPKCGEPNEWHGRDEKQRVCGECRWGE